MFWEEPGKTKIFSKLVFAFLTRIIKNNGDTLKIGMFWVSPVFYGEWVRTKKVKGRAKRVYIPLDFF